MEWETNKISFRTIKTPPLIPPQGGNISLNLMAVTPIKISYLFSPLKKSFQIPPNLPFKREEKQISPFAKGDSGTGGLYFDMFFKTLNCYQKSENTALGQKMLFPDGHYLAVGEDVNDKT